MKCHGKLVKLAIVFVALTVVWQGHGAGAGKIDKDLLKKLKKQFRVDVLINFVGSNTKVVNWVQEVNFQTRQSKVVALIDGLQGLSLSVQDAIVDFLSSQGVHFQSFWSSNQIVARSLNLLQVQGVASFGQVGRIQLLPKVKLVPIQSQPAPVLGAVQWGVAKIQADQVWSQHGINGQGVVVANIDTGVRGTHEALSGNWRSDHGWFDPYNGTATPNDQNGHGSHTMGTIAGANGIGVAPGAQWIACKGCNSSSCDAAQLLSCGQWMLQPTTANGTDPDPTKIPDVVSNSWGSVVAGDSWYNATIDAWKAAGILHAFAIGNQGPGCPSLGSPGDQPGVLSVGSTDSGDKLSYFSSRSGYGPTIIKPEVCAPGGNVYSSWYTADNAYNTISGTSMATPHVAGTIALMLSAYREKMGDPTARLTHDQVVATLEQTTDTKNLTLGSYFSNPRMCGQSKTYPNSYFGYGRINALNATTVTVK